jgi:hypothetical protein
MKKTLTVPELHQRRIALNTLRMHEAGAMIMGGMDHIKAVQVLRKFGHTDKEIRTRLETAEHDTDAIARYMQ